MLKKILKIVPPIFFSGVFIYVIFNVPYPETITQANITQLLSFFVTLFLSLTFSFNLFLRNIFISTAISIGLIFLFSLKALDSLNLVTAILILIPVVLLISYFRKIKRKGLTNFSKIPKLTKLRKLTSSSRI